MFVELADFGAEPLSGCEGGRRRHIARHVHLDLAGACLDALLLVGLDLRAELREQCFRRADALQEALNPRVLAPVLRLPHRLAVPADVALGLSVLLRRVGPVPGPTIKRIFRR
eukprot:3023204-Alexandrium_andersonii.AAC.1